MYKRYFIIILLFAANQLAYGQWKLHTTTSYGKLWAAHFLNSNNGWAVGENGTILHYNGVSWTKVSSPTNTFLTTVAFLDSLNGWAAGDSGIILYYNGVSWQKQEIVTNSTIWDISVLSKNFGYALSAFGEVFKYDGISWANLDTNFKKSFYSLYIVDENNIWISGSVGQIYKQSVNGWIDYRFPYGNYRSIFCTDTSTCWAVGDFMPSEKGIISKYENGAWHYNSDTLEKPLRSVYFVNDHLGWAAGYKAAIYKYNGLCWTKQKVEYDQQQLIEAICFTNEHLGWAFCTNGDILYTTNGGDSLSSLKNDEPDYLIEINPNPFINSVTISYNLHGSAPFICTIKNMEGKEVRLISDKSASPGHHEMIVNLEDLPPGLYTCIFTLSNKIITKKMIKL
jgi:photosystem II stability/assembly factor-like uncharacterized protein